MEDSVGAFMLVGETLLITHCSLLIIICSTNVSFWGLHVAGDCDVKPD